MKASFLFVLQSELRNLRNKGQLRNLKIVSYVPFTLVLNNIIIESVGIQDLKFKFCTS